MKTLLTSLILALAATSCATNPNMVRPLEDTKLDIKGQIGNHKLGLNSKNEVVLQEETKAQDELRIQESVNFSFLEDLRREAAELNRCRKDMADPRLGGSGILPEEQDFDNLKPQEEVQEQFGMDESGDLKFVRKSYFLERLKIARGFRVTLEKLIKMTVRHRNECEFKMTQARLKVGLPAARIMAEGYFTDRGSWVEVRKGENSLGDAFEIQADRQAGR